MAAMLHGRNYENILHKKKKNSDRKKNLLFLPCNIAAVQNLYPLYMAGGVKFELVNQDSVGCSTVWS